MWSPSTNRSVYIFAMVFLLTWANLWCQTSDEWDAGASWASCSFGWLEGCSAMMVRLYNVLPALFTIISVDSFLEKIHLSPIKTTLTPISVTAAMKSRLGHYLCRSPTRSQLRRDGSWTRYLVPAKLCFCQFSQSGNTFPFFHVVRITPCHSSASHFK